MTRQIAAGCFAALFGLAVSAGAQTPPSTPQTPPSPSTPSTPSSPYPSAQSADRAAKGEKLTGCIQAGTSANSFELVKKSAGAAGAPSAGAPAGAPSASASGDKAAVKLVASPSVDLATHVGHTVELSGNWAKGDAAGAPPAAGASSSMSKEFNVTSVKMVSSTCSAGTN